MQYTGSRILVTGGLGFIGSNLAVRLARQGAHVTVVDNHVEGCGANRFNLNEVARDIEILDADIGDIETYPDVLRRSDVIFNLAGEISHTRSMVDPLRDITLNTISQLKFLLAIKKYAPGRRVVYAGTRQVYGSPRRLPVDENHPLEPIDFNGIHKLATAHYHDLLTRLGDLDALVLRLTNVYGPRMALDQPGQGFLGHFFRRALLGEPLTVFGDGAQLRDPLHVDDAVDAFLLAGAAVAPRHRTYNVGGGMPFSLRQIAEQLCGLTGSPLHTRPFPPEYKAIDIGSYATDSTRFRRAFGWQPRVEFAAGAARTLDYFRLHARHYIAPPEAAPLVAATSRTTLRA